MLVAVGRARHTCFDGVFQRRPAGQQNFLQGLGLIRQFPVIFLKQLVWVVEINHFSGSVEILHHILEQNVHHIL